jgi:hypothetical protein
MINDKIQAILNEDSSGSAITKINKRLKSLGREERLVRGRGYYYLRGGEASGFPNSSIYQMWIEPNEFESVWEEIKDMFKKADIILKETSSLDRVNANSPAVTMPIMSRN